MYCTYNKLFTKKKKSHLVAVHFASVCVVGRVVVVLVAVAVGIETEKRKKIL